MTKRIAILLHGELQNDYRVIKTVETLSKDHFIDVFYIQNTIPNDDLKFSERVKLHGYKEKKSFYLKLLRHSFFCFEFNFFCDEIVKNGIKYDTIWANDLPTLFPAFRIAKKINAQLIYDSHEIYTETINQFFPRKSKGIKKVIFRYLISLMRWHGKKIEKKIIPSVKLFITVNESILDYYCEKHAIKNGLVLMNLPRTNFNGTHKKKDYFKEYNWSKDSKILIYQGDMNEGRGLINIIKTLEILPFDYKLVLVGNGTLKVQLIKNVKDLALQDRIKFIDFVPLEQLSTYTKGADLGINLLESFNLSKQLASPNKLFEYIHAGIPVLASETIENKKVLANFRVGEITKNEPSAIAKTIQFVFSGSKESPYTDGLKKGKAHYNWENQEGKLLSCLNKSGSS